MTFFYAYLCTVVKEKEETIYIIYIKGVVVIGPLNNRDKFYPQNTPPVIPSYESVDKSVENMQNEP
jgi:hypothetical protein